MFISMATQANRPFCVLILSQRGCKNAALTRSRKIIPSYSKKAKAFVVAVGKDGIVQMLPPVSHENMRGPANVGQQTGAIGMGHFQH